MVIVVFEIYVLSCYVNRIIMFQSPDLRIFILQIIPPDFMTHIIHMGGFISRDWEKNVVGVSGR